MQKLLQTQQLIYISSHFLPCASMQCTRTTLLFQCADFVYVSSPSAALPPLLTPISDATSSTSSNPPQHATTPLTPRGESAIKIIYMLVFVPCMYYLDSSSQRTNILSLARCTTSVQKTLINYIKTISRIRFAAGMRMRLLQNGRSDRLSLSLYHVHGHGTTATGSAL